MSEAVPGDRFLVSPGAPLEGTVHVGGAKNSVLKLMAACMLAEGRHVISGVPHIADVEIMAEVLASLGLSCRRVHDGDPEVARSGAEPGDLVIDTPGRLSTHTPYELAERLRASVVVLGPLLARAAEASVPLPGGDDFGSRPIDLHLHGLSLLGAEFATVHGNIEGHVSGHPARLVGSRIVLEYPSHTATDNLLMAAVLAKGTTVIENAAREPEVADLAAFLSQMGARITGAGTSHLVVEGVEELQPAPRAHRVIPDRVVAATFLSAVGLAGGEIVIEDARPEHMDMLLRKMTAMGVETSHTPEGLRAVSNGPLHSVDVATLPYPGVATDYKPLVVTMLSVADGVGIVSENLFSGRFRYVDELRRMGADIGTEGHHAVVRGVQRLQGAPVRAPDIRAGAALVLAGLVAEGETVVSEAGHVHRGYENFAGKLRSLGADVRVV